jgi:hypothetical protein
MSGGGQSGVGRFFAQEAERGGWRFFVLWLAATNLGFFPGMELGQALSAGVAEPLASGIVACGFALPVGLLQAWVLQRHWTRVSSWVVATTLGWLLGATLGSALLRSLAPGASEDSALWIVGLGFLSGGLVGLGQTPLVRRYRPELAAGWWLISAVSWAVLFPGAISGFVLTPGMRRA